MTDVSDDDPDLDFNLLHLGVSNHVAVVPKQDASCAKKLHTQISTVSGPFFMTNLCAIVL